MSLEPVVSNVFDQAIAELQKKSTAIKYRQDPVLWTKEVLGIHLWSKQRDIAMAVVNQQHVAVRSCHNAGKSKLAAILACWWIATHPIGEALVITTAPTYSQVHGIIWREISKHHELAKATGNPLPGYVTNQDKWNVQTATNIVQMGWGRKPADSNMHAFQGVHERYVFVIVDEACGITENLFTAVEAITTTADSRILAIGNPDDPNTQFGKMFNDHNVAAEWFPISVSAYDTPNLTVDHMGHTNGCDDERCLRDKWAERAAMDANLPDELRPLLLQKDWVFQHERMWGLGSPRVSSKILGEFPMESTNSMFSQSTIDRGVSTVVKPDRSERPVLGVDVARFGDDYSTIYQAETGTVWLIDDETEAEIGPKLDNKGNPVKGKQVRFLKSKAKADGVEVANWIHQTALETGAAEVRIDVSGMGAPIKDMVTLKAEESYAVIGMNGSGPTPDRYRWRNARAWWHDDFRQQMSDGRIDLDYSDQNLKDELLGIQYHFKNNWRAIQVESKEDMSSRGVKSPDFSDAAIYASAPLDELLSGPLAFYNIGDRISFDPAQIAGIAGQRVAILGPF